MRAFLSFLESRGAGEVCASELRDLLESDGPAVRAALVAAGAIRPASPATTHPCDGLGCAREVRERPRGKDGARRFLAVCTRSPRECETVHVGEADLAQEAIALDALIDAVRRALKIEAPLGGGAVATKRAGAGEPLHVGEQAHDGVVRDVFFARKPGTPLLRALLAERRATARGTLVLVPTARGIDPALLAGHGAGHVEIAALTDLLVVAGGKIAAAQRLRVVRSVAPAMAPPARAPANDARKKRSVADLLPRAKRWGDVTLYSVPDERSIGVLIDRRHRRFTAAELGLAVGRSGEPVRAFELLRRICDGNGVFDTRPWGGRDNGKQIVTELRRALSAAFEIAESPIETYSRRAKSWKTRFVALPGTPSEVKAAEAAILGEGRGEGKKR